MIDFMGKKKKPKRPDESNLSSSNVPTPEEFEAMPLLSVEERLAQMDKMSERELFESILISDVASFVLSLVPPEVRSVKVLSAVTSESGKFALSLINNIGLRSALTRNQLLSRLKERATRSHTDVTLHVEEVLDDESFDA